MSKRKKPAHISQEAWDSVDIPELTEDFFKNACPAKEVLPPALYQTLVEHRKRGERGPQKTPTKVPTKIRIDADVLEAYKAKGRGWQTRMNEALRVAIQVPK